MFAGKIIRTICLCAMLASAMACSGIMDQAKPSSGGMDQAKSFAAPLPSPIPTASPAACSDWEVVKAIYKKLKADPKLKDDIQGKHINIGVVYREGAGSLHEAVGTIVLSGYAVNQDIPVGSPATPIPDAVRMRDVNLALQLAKSVGCASNRKVINELKPAEGGSCDPPEKQLCDGICISANVTCNLPPPPGGGD